MCIRDRSRLTTRQREETLAAFGPEDRMRLYDRGIRRRLAPMLGNDRRRLQLAYALQFSLRGTPVLRYGDEIGMGEDLSLPGRNAIRTPMQWSPARNGGFSGVLKKDLVRPVIATGDYSYKRVNVTDQRHDPGSLLSWFERMIRTVRECPEIGAGSCRSIDVDLPPGVLAHRADAAPGMMAFLHNLSDQPAKVDLSSLAGEVQELDEVLADQAYPPLTELGALEIDGYGYRWIRLCRNSG